MPPPPPINARLVTTVYQHASAGYASFRSDAAGDQFTRDAGDAALSLGIQTFKDAAGLRVWNMTNLAGTYVVCIPVPVPLEVTDDSFRNARSVYLGGFGLDAKIEGTAARFDSIRAYIGSSLAHAESTVNGKTLTTDRMFKPPRPVLLEGGCFVTVSMRPGPGRQWNAAFTGVKLRLVNILTTHSDDAGPARS